MIGVHELKWRSNERKKKKEHETLGLSLISVLHMAAYDVPTITVFWIIAFFKHTLKRTLSVWIKGKYLVVYKWEYISGYLLKACRVLQNDPT